MAAFEDGEATVATQYCAPFMNSHGQWQAGFFCPPKASGQKTFCCGTPTFKYCCDNLEDTHITLLPGSAPVSSIALFTAIIVTFILTVMTTVVAFICCRKFWKNREALEIEETHSYRMTTGDPLHAAINSYETLDPERLQSTSGNCMPLETYLPLSSYIDRNSMAFMEPPPPYQVNPGQVTGGQTASNRIFAVIGGPYRRDLIYPGDGRKPLWRTLSQ